MFDGLTVLINQHANGNTGHEKSVQKILDAVLCLIVHVVGFFQFQNALGHRLDDIAVPVSYFYQGLTKSAKQFIKDSYNNNNSCITIFIKISYC